MLHQAVQLSADPVLRGLPQALEAPGVGFFLGHLRVPAQLLHAVGDGGTADGLPVPGLKQGAGGESPAPGLVQQLPPKKVRQADRADRCTLYRLHGEPGQVAHGEVGAAEQLDQQIQPLLAQSPGSGQQT